MEGREVKDTSLTMRAQQIILAADQPVNSTDALVEALRERGLSYDELLKMIAGQLSTKSLRNSTYNIPEQDGLFAAPSVISISTPDGDLFIKGDMATNDQMAEWADGGLQFHSTQRLRFKRAKKDIATVREMAGDGSLPYSESRLAITVGGDE
jgi:hypothetical protein